jgi:hypothetical protein
MFYLNLLPLACLRFGGPEHIKDTNDMKTLLYNRVMKKKGKAKATIAASRKMLTIIWHMLVKGERFKYVD